MNIKIIKNSRRIKIHYKDGKNRWFAECTKKDYLNGLGWFQWGSSAENLYKTVEQTEKEVNEWANEFCNEN